MTGPARPLLPAVAPATRAGSSPARSPAAPLIAGWAVAAAVAGWTGGPTWLLVPLVAGFALIGPGLAVGLRLPGIHGEARVAVSVLAGPGALVLVSQALVQLGYWLPSGPELTITALATATLALLAGPTLLRGTPRRSRWRS